MTEQDLKLIVGRLSLKAGNTSDSWAARLSDRVELGTWDEVEPIYRKRAKELAHMYLYLGRDVNPA